MRHYLATLHTRSHRHKKNFAMAVSGGITLMIFGFWTLANFGQGGILANRADESAKPKEVSPLESLRESMAASFEGLKDNFSELKSGFGSVDFEATYDKLKGGAIDTYNAR